MAEVLSESKGCQSECGANASFGGYKFTKISKTEPAKKCNPSDYPNSPEKCSKYFNSLLPTFLLKELQSEHKAENITACKGSFIKENHQDYVVGFISRKKKKGFAKVFSIDEKKMKLLNSW